MRSLFATLLLLWLCMGCQPESEPAPAEPTQTIATPQPQNKADSLALQIVEATGGSATWAQVPFLRFDFAVEREGERQIRARHFWDRQMGDYRVEMQVGEDSTVVVLMNINTREGMGYLNGTPLDSAATSERLEAAYGRFINDTYWLLAPTKVLDPGVQRTYVADSSNAETDVLHLSFQDVGLTPGDQYWFYADRATGQVTRWAYVLEKEPADQPPRSFVWTGYESYDTPAGPVTVSTRKEHPTDPFAILTDNVATPAEPPARVFSEPTPMLGD